ncbi:MAG: DNA/RNA non-specific endonuclease, partial [Saprospiraceae bacterium]
MHQFCCFLLLLLTTISQGQSTAQQQLAQLEQDLTQIETNKKSLLAQIENTKLTIYHEALLAHGLPALATDETIIHHSLLSLVYSEAHEQAKWVAHVIAPDILNGDETRSNDFREDPKVTTGTAIEEDYFLRIIDAAGKTTYDGFGWDRGHLAPSADFRWSKKALSESYFYSNMSPQVPDFNRKNWAALENDLRAYVYREQVPLYLVTGGVLTPDLPVIERSIQKVAIPEFFWKVAIDLTNKRGIAFLMPNKLAD